MSLLIKNAKIYVERDRFAQALLVADDGTIVAVGSLDEVEPIALNPHVYDAGARTIVPGFHDSHQHLMRTGEALAAVQLHGCTSIAEVIERGRSYIEKHHVPEGESIYGLGWNQDYFTDARRLLTRDDLDQISTKHPIIFERACIHILTCNSCALEMAGITPETPVNPGGAIDVENGELTGVIRENAMSQVKSLLSAQSVEVKKRYIRTAMAHACQCGITSVQTCDLSASDWEETFAVYDEVLGETPHLRVTHQANLSQLEALADFFTKGYRTGYGTDFNRIGAVKLFADGSLGARTALMRSPYQDDPTSQGMATLTREELDAVVSSCVEHETSLVVHAIGDGAIERVLDSFDAVCDGANPYRLGVVHVQITDRALLERFKTNDISALVQPIFLHYDTGIVESRVGRVLASTSYAFKSLIDMGVHTSFGTDSPVEDMNPFANIYCAVTRQNLLGFPQGGFHPEECVDVQQAVDSYTVESAFASFEETRKGRLKPGFFADLVVLSDDIFTIEPNRIKDVCAMATMVNGKWAFVRQ